MNTLFAVLLAYLAGSVPFGFLLVRLTTGNDVRAAGSGNIGATNVLRTAGRTVGIATLVLDIAKGYTAVWLAALLTERSDLGTSAAALAVMLGHAYPVFLKFRGGKALASFIGAFLYLTPLPLAATLLVFVVTVVATRYVSLGSVLAAGCLPLAAWLISHSPRAVLIAAVLAGALVIWRHKANLRRLYSGTEHTFSFRPGRK
jgi:glycerol-3-phosphate acyltransferase PlsY